MATRSRIPAALLAAGAIMFATACSTDADSNAQDSSAPTTAPTAEVGPTTSEPDSSTSTSQDADATQTGPSDTGELLAVDAITAAEDLEPGGTVVSVDYERDQLAWEVEILTESGEGIELLVDAQTGEELGRMPTNLDEEQMAAPSVSAQDAANSGLEAKPGTITSLELEREAGIIIWQLDITADDGSEWELDIDSETGEVLSTEQD